MPARVRTRQERARRAVYIAFGAVVVAAFLSFLSAVVLSSAYPKPQVPYGVQDPQAHALREPAERK